MAWIRTTFAAGCLTLGLILPQISGGQERVGAVSARRDPGVSAAAHVRDVYGRDAQVRNALARSTPVQQPNPDDTLVEPIPRPETTLEEAASHLLDAGLPAGYEPWWRARVLRPLRPSPEIYPLDLDALVVSALAYSPRVRAISENVLIQETVVVEERAAFDPRSFAESRFFRRSQPIGNLLETGGPPRWREEDWGLSGGLRKRTPMGGSWEIAQRIGTQASNSKFFIPEQQRNAKMALSFNQPLLNGFGKVYNTSLIVLAELDTQAAADETSAALQQQLTTIADTYWELYLQRSVLVQKHEHLDRAMSVLKELERRREIDALESQIVRAQAAVAARQSELVRAAANVQNIEARLRALTNAPDLMAHAYAELIPLNQPGTTRVDVELQDALVTALQHRPEIDAAAQAIRAAGVRLNMSRNELLPALDLVLETYVMGLDADYDIGAAFADQYAEGEPSYAAGFVFEVPLQRRAAKAQLQRRSLQLRQVTEQFDATVQMLLADVEVAVRDVQASYQEMVGKYRAMRAATAEVEYSTRRWQLLAGEERSAGLLLEDLLDAQDRLVVEEFGFALAQHSYAVSQTALKQAMGTLLEQEGINSYRTCQGGIPQLQFQKFDSFAAPAETLPAGQSRFGEQTDLRATLR
jgi:outer membrane protein TolC